MHRSWSGPPLLGLLVAVVSFASSAGATTLTFDVGMVSDLDAIDQSYGDDVEAAFEGGLAYFLGPEGATPNVQTSYAAGHALWTTGFGNLVNVLFSREDTGPPFVEITLTADAGFLVTLFAFDLAAFTADFVSAPTIDAVTVSDGASTLFEQLDATISHTTSTAFDFSAAPLSAATLIIRVDASNLGTLRDDIAIDDVRFGQTVPEPAPALLLAGCLGLLAAGRSRRPPAARSD